MWTSTFVTFMRFRSSARLPKREIVLPEDSTGRIVAPQGGGGFKARRPAAVSITSEGSVHFDDHPDRAEKGTRSVPAGDGSHWAGATTGKRRAKRRFLDNRVVRAHA